MTVPPATLTPYSPGDPLGFTITQGLYATEVLQQGARTKLLIEPVAAFPASPALTDICNRSDLGAWFRCTNATGPVWSQMSVPSFTTAAAPAAPPTNFVYFDTTLSGFEEYNGSAYVSVSSGGGGGTSSAFGAHSTSTQTFTGGAAATQVTFPTADYNVGGNYTAATSLYTAPAAGQYLLTGSIALVNSTSANNIVAYVEINGTTDTILYDTVLPLSATLIQEATFATFLNLASGDVVKIWASASVTVSTNAGAGYTHWHMAQVGAGPQGATGAAGATGATGSTGSTGAAGAPGITWQSAWAIGTTYALHDGVTNGGESFLSLGAGNVGNTPTAGTGDAHWLILAQKGATGSTGSPGTLPEGATFPGSPALNDLYFRTDLSALHQCTNATGPVWTQVSVGAFTTAARPASPPTNFRYYDTTTAALVEYTGSAYVTITLPAASAQHNFITATSTTAFRSATPSQARRDMGVDYLKWSGYQGSGKPTASVVIDKIDVDIAGSISSTPTSGVSVVHFAHAETGATATTTFTIKNNGTSIGTIVFASGGSGGAQSGTVSITSSPTALAKGDRLTLSSPAQDASLAGVGYSLYIDTGAA